MRSGCNGIHFIVNPHAATGAVGKQWARIQARARDRLGTFAVRMTTGPWDAFRLTRHALEDGAQIVVCVGGDGTFNEVVNGFMGPEGCVKPDAMLAYIPRGTGCDFIRTVSVPRDLERVLDLIRDARGFPIDLGRLQYRDPRHRPSTRYFHNVVSFGLGGEVDDRVNRTTKVFGGFFSFIWATLISLLLYDKKRIHLKLDNGFDETLTAWNIAVANGQYHGGGMWVAPEARIDDGMFHVTMIGDYSLREVFRHLPKLYNGRLLELEKVRCVKALRVEARSEQRVLLDVDGEQPGRLPVIVEMAPRALSLIAETPG